MIPENKLDELRSLVAETPDGSVARTLLTMIDEANVSEKRRDRKKLLDLVRQQGRTPEEAETLVSAYEAGGEVEMETIRCWGCEGWGSVLGPNGERECSTCLGCQKASRFKMPVSKEQT